jgi:hypothetical protein
VFDKKKKGDGKKDEKEILSTGVVKDFIENNMDMGFLMPLFSKWATS